MHCVPTRNFPPQAISPTRILSPSNFVPHRKLIFKKSKRFCGGAFLATDARIFGDSQDTFRFEIWKKSAAQPLGAGWHQIWVKASFTRDIVPVGTKLVLQSLSKTKSFSICAYVAKKSFKATKVI